jgi:LmbE family N-acetylglucosaminyl deacetylase
VVFVVPHADDESLFAGELLNHYARASAHITVVYTTTSSGGAAQRFFPAFRAARAAVRDSVLRNLGTVEITVAPVPDGGGWGRMSGPRRLRLVHRFLTEPGVVPADVPIFVIGGAGNSDHYIAFDEARRLAWSRNQPLYVYWGYGRDHDHLDPHRVGTPVDAQPTAGDRAFKLRAIRQYMTRLYDRYPYDRYLPNIMRLPARDDLVTELAPGTSLAGLDMPAPGHATPKPNTVAGALEGAVAQIGALFAHAPH